MSTVTLPDKADAALDRLGERIRFLRSERSMTLQDVANRSGVSVAMLSHIERGRSTPSIKVLDRVRQALGVSFSEFFGEPSLAAEPEANLVSRADNRPFLKFDAMNLSKELLSPVRGTEIEMMLLHLGKGGHSGDEPWRRVGVKCGMVIDGKFELTIGTSVHTLSKGDAFQFDSSFPHSFRNLHEGESTIMWVIFSKELA